MLLNIKWVRSSLMWYATTTLGFMVTLTFLAWTSWKSHPELHSLARHATSEAASRNLARKISLKDGWRHKYKAAQQTSHPDRFRCKSGYIQRLPDVILIGERKCSTFAILKFLSQINPMIRYSGLEAHFFDKDRKLGRKDLEEYRKLMPYSCPKDLTAEKTPNYFRYSHVPKAIYQYKKDVKLLLSLRDPVGRALSEYHFLLRKYQEGKDLFWKYSHYENSTFEKLAMPNEGVLNTTFEPIVYSKYDMFLKQWLDVFPMSQIHIIDADSFIKDNPAKELMKIEQFLGIPRKSHKNKFVFDKSKGFYCMAGKPCLSSEKGHHYEPLRPGIRKILEDHFKTHVQNLHNQTGLTLSWMTKYLQ